MTATEMWKMYCEASGTPVDEPHSAWAFGGAPDELARLVMAGIKTATASAFDLYALDGDEPMPKEGDLSVILDGREDAKCVIKTTKITIVPYCDVTAEHAFREGERDRTLASWRAIHEEFFAGEFAEYGLNFDETRKIVCEEFEVVYQK